ncbi:MAG TPA: ribonuclease III [Chromatiaceae bacterium]|nr:ribonuclease III [Chromatiaceae bacterium]HIN81381.1 ribonuclease III [Chromatiales bacterium]HIA09323.1 ribonuclease III [Chromatiaceae bacterium]HIB83223.1 ribonuclease III [Chromatiaceae bacterium]HIO13808.1 ribonuclease III [Chromatiales bacterium]
MIRHHKHLCEQLEYQFSDQSLIGQALTHRSFGAEHNERLEFLGDAVLGLIVAELLYAHFPVAKEGRLSRLRANLVQKRTLASVARALAIGDYLRLGTGEQRSGGHSRDSTLADAFEAVLGAIYLDGGYGAASQVIHKIFTERLANLPDEGDEKDPKTQLQEYLQGRHKPLPQYTVVHLGGSPHKQTFEVECQAEGLSAPAIGNGNSRRGAEQDAALIALERLQQVHDHA